MKKFDIFKTIQLIVYIILTVVCIIKIAVSPGTFHNLAGNPDVRLLCFLLWIILGISFLCIFLDYSLFSDVKNDLRALRRSVVSDPVAGIANRFSCDAVIDEFADKEVPDSVGCIMFGLSNLYETNKLYGRKKGNELIRDFSMMLNMASVDLCFVGRNGGDRFLAVFKNSDKEKVDMFLERLKTKTAAHNTADSTCPIVYAYGMAMQREEHVKAITELIALANQRIPRKSEEA